MDERGNTTKSTYNYQNKRSVLAYSLFTIMFIIGVGGVFFFYNFTHNGPIAAATFTPFLSSALTAGRGSKCTIIPDAEDFTPCSSDWENIADSQVLRCPSGYGNIEVTKVKDGETGRKNYRDLALLRSFCQGTDSCRLTLGDLRAADDGMPLADQELIPVNEEPEVDPEAIIEDIAGVDSNGEILLKSHGHHHHHHHHPGQVKIIYECEKLEESPFAELEAFFEDLMGPEPATEETGFVHEETSEEIILSKHHKHGCHNKLKNIAQDWDAGTACGTAGSEMTLGCDQSRSGARIYVLNVKAKIPKPPAVDPNTEPSADAGAGEYFEDEPSSVESEPFLAKHGHHGHGGGHHGHKGQGKQLGHELTDVCAGLSECTTTLNVDLQASLAANPEIDDNTEMHVKYMCSYGHQEN